MEKEVLFKENNIRSYFLLGPGKIVWITEPIYFSFGAIFIILFFGLIFYGLSTAIIRIVSVAFEKITFFSIAWIFTMTVLFGCSLFVFGAIYFLIMIFSGVGKNLVIYDGSVFELTASKPAFLGMFSRLKKETITINSKIKKIYYFSLPSIDRYKKLAFVFANGTILEYMPEYNPSRKDVGRSIGLFRTEEIQEIGKRFKVPLKEISRTEGDELDTFYMERYGAIKDLPWKSIFARKFGELYWYNISSRNLILTPLIFFLVLTTIKFIIFVPRIFSFSNILAVVVIVLYSPVFFITLLLLARFIESMIGIKIRYTKRSVIFVMPIQLLGGILPFGYKRNTVNGPLKKIEYAKIFAGEKINNFLTGFFDRSYSGKNYYQEQYKMAFVFGDEKKVTLPYFVGFSEMSHFTLKQLEVIASQFDVPLEKVK